MLEPSLQHIINIFENLFSKINTRFYGGTLEPATITVSSKGRKNCSGWCTTQKVWHNKHEQEKEGHFEINICAEFLQDPFEHIVEILLHEMAHLYNLQMGIQDCSRSGKYHNKHFKEVAEKHGLVAEKDKCYGFCHTKLNEEAREFLSTIDPVVINLSRELSSRKENEGRRQNNRKYVCPKCGMITRTTRELNATCDTCHQKFVMI